jgi:transcriptional regulator with XRE-family HTH domain
MSSNVLTKRLKDEMKKQNWTGRKLSTEANLSYNAIHYILSGKNKSTNFEVVNAIAGVLGVSPFYLLDENYDKNNKSHNTQIKLDSKGSAKKEISEEIPYDGELYREIMSIVEELLDAKNSLTTGQIEYFTHYIYSQIQKMDFEGQGKTRKKNIRSYAEGIIDYALNRMD